MDNRGSDNWGSTILLKMVLMVICPKLQQELSDGLLSSPVFLALQSSLSHKVVAMETKLFSN